MPTRFKTFALQVLTHLAALLPLVVIVWDWTQDRLTANPISEIQLRTGRYALLLLVLSLSCTPISKIFGVRWVLPLRRTLGLYAFMYASLHLLNFVGLDYGFNFPLILEDWSGKRFVLAGLVAFLCLLPLAITSTMGWMRRLRRNWERVHWLVYPAALLAVVHFFWQTKADFRRPILYAVVVAVLLVVRLPWVGQGLRKLCSRRSPVKER
ncbi:MAG: sulfoxide reductase heme-binding subunit YedZ [Chloroflexi bacterium]|nr:sulfoxide reductase heme-binding subunit YedZ [Chloroflexota bacterium]